MDLSYKFERKDRILVLSSSGLEEHSQWVDLEKDKWFLPDSITISWVHKELRDHPLLDFFKGFICHYIENFSASHTYRHYCSLRHLVKYHYDFESDIPDSLIDYLNPRYDRLMSIRIFLKWVLNFKTNDTQILKQLKQLDKVNALRRNSYEHVFLSQNEFNSEYQFKFLNLLKLNWEQANGNISSYSQLLILQIAFELGIRPIQISSLNTSDFVIIEEKGSIFASLRILKAKQISSKQRSYESKSISQNLGIKIRLYCDLNQITSSEALLQDSHGQRFTTKKISNIINKALTQIGFDTKSFGGVMVLRHSFAQSLANQGASADEIAANLLHNSTVPARAYIAATPNIAEIKSRALGRSNRFREILKMLETGVIKDKSETSPETWISGLVGNRYIGGIGSCGLSSPSPCTKNPVYSCYTCQKFHPFKTSNHQEVLDSLSIEAEKFIQAAINSGDQKFNRTIDQLELTIESVNRTIELIHNG